jgi:macrolide transport system ATP-binding/permease protein
VDSRSILDDQETMLERISHSQAAYFHRSTALVAIGFALLALFLGIVGLYGVISFSVGQRTREIGVRIALGAQRQSVYELVMKEAARLIALGIGLGMCISLITNNLIRGLLFATAPWDPKALIFISAILSLSALMASFFPPDGQLCSIQLKP